MPCSQAVPPVPLGGPLSREESRKNIMRDLEPKVTGQATADMAAFIADEFSRLGITGIEWADPE